jgi:competence ComEA-like helix-hairpin-helix protein
VPVGERRDVRKAYCSNRFSGRRATRSCGSRAGVFEAPICLGPRLCTMPTGGQAVGDARVRINTATADKLNGSLSGIGPEQAQLIVAYREERGYLRGPEDLGRVEGIDRDTAAALAPHIDWSVPPEQERIQQREWGWALAAVLTLLAFLWQLAFGLLPALVDAIQGSNPLDIWYAATSTGLQAGLVLGMSALVAFFLTEDRRRARKAVLVGFAGLIVAFLAYLSATLATAFRYLFLDSGGWAELRRNPQELASVPTAAAIALVALPVLLVLWKPALAGSPRLARLFDMGLALAALGLALVVWAFGGASPLWFSVLNGLWGLFFGYVALRALRSGESPFFPLARFLAPERDAARPAGVETAWGTWLNLRLPDEEDQRALKRYLDQRYPGSRSRSVLYALTVGGSLWLVAHGLGGAVEWLVGKGLERVFGL